MAPCTFVVLPPCSPMYVHIPGILRFMYTSLYLVFYMNRIILFPAQFFKKYAVFLIFALLFKLSIYLNAIKIFLSLYFSHLLVVFIVVRFFHLPWAWILLNTFGLWVWSNRKIFGLSPLFLEQSSQTLGISQGIKGARNVFCSQQWSDFWYTP